MGQVFDVDYRILDFRCDMDHGLSSIEVGCS